MSRINTAGSPFTLANIPFGVISTTHNPQKRCATAIGDSALDLAILAGSNLLDDLKDSASIRDALRKPSLNTFAALPRASRSALRQRVIDLLSKDSVPSAALIPMKDVQMHHPMEIGGFSDFLCSLHHLENCAPMTGGKVPQNFYTIPLVYNSRASSVVVSGQPITRPKGVVMQDGKPVYENTKALDYELELGIFVSKPVPFGETIKIEDAGEHIFGLVLLNDWSSRDIQGFEMNPLGPFHSKGSATSISPWIVTLDALEQFSCGRDKNLDRTLPHLELADSSKGCWDIEVQAWLIRDGVKTQLCKSNLKESFWTPYQLVTHHASAMCGLNSGDLMGTGTLSGTEVDESGKKIALGCLFESTKNGTEAKVLEDGEQLTYLQDGDEVVLTAWCGGEGNNRVLGFGECSGVVLPNKQP